MADLKTGFAKFGTAMPREGITKFKAKMGDTRIKILSISEQDFLMARFHYLKGIGSFHCFGGSCCDAVDNAGPDNGNTQERAILPIAVYMPNITGGVSVDYQYIPLTATKYSTLESLNTNVGDVSAYDLLIKCTDETFQKWEITPLANQAPLINSIEGELQRAEVFLAKYRLDIRKTIGKDFTEQTFQAARMAAATNAAKGLGANTNFVPNNAASQVFAQPQVAPALPTMQQPVAQATTQPTPVAVAQPIPTVATVVIEPTKTTPIAEVKVEEPKKETKKATKAESTAPVADVTPVATTAAQAVTTPVVETGIAIGDVTTGATAPTEVVNAEEIDWSAYISQ